MFLFPRSRFFFLTCSRNIKPLELLKRVFGEKQYLTRETPNVTAVVDHISRMSQLATTLVVKAKKLPDRVQVLKKLINVATVRFFPFTLFIFLM